MTKKTMHSKRSAQGAEATLAGRVRLLIDRFWGGSVNAAANDLGISQPTLNRIATGTTPNPRARVLQQIATACQTTVDWLMTGQGQAPRWKDDKGRPLSASFARWMRLTEELGLPEHLRSDLFEVATGPDGFAIFLEGHKKSAASQALVDAAWRSSEICADAWADLLEVATAQLGAKTVRQRILANPIACAAGFTEFGLFLRDGKGLSKTEIARCLQRWRKDLDDVIADLDRL